MMKNKSKVLLSLALTVLIGAVAVGANSYFIAHALVGTNGQGDAVTAADHIRPVSGTEKAGSVIEGDGKIVQAVVDRDRQSAEGDRNSGFIHGIPSKDDLAKEDAINIARDALIEEFALTDETLAMFSISSMFNIADPEAPKWSIVFYPTNQNDFSKIGTYNILIDSLSGKILKILTAADGVG